MGVLLLFYKIAQMLKKKFTIIIHNEMEKGEISFMKKTVKRAIGIVLAAAMTAASIPASNFGSFVPSFVKTAEAASAITIDASNTGGGLEAAWAEWSESDTASVSGFVVSYSKGSGSYTNVDDNLIRQYQDGHWRVDIPGLAAGSYTIKIDAVDSSKKVIQSATTSSLTVRAHDRRGFAFASGSKNYDNGACGAYNADGTPKSGADIIYIKKAADIDTVTLNGKTGLSTILQGRDKVATNPLIVRIIGKIDYSGLQLNGSGYIQVKPSKPYTKSDITIEGIGPDTTINFGFLLRNASNVEIRNLAIHDFKDDGISLDTDNSNIWVHNNEIFYGVQGSGDKAKGDGATDVKNDSQYVTISYNHYWDGGKCSLCGMKSEGGDNFISYHHNWFDHSDSRHPRIRTMSVHVFNNYYDGNAKYGVGASEKSSAFVENNYFRNCKYPTLQGSVGCDSDGNGGSTTLEDSNPIGAVKFCGNTVEGANSNWKTDSDGNKAGSGDACLVTDRTKAITYTTEAGATYNNFDTSGNMGTYIRSLTPDTPAAAKDKVLADAGRIGGGDFSKSTGFNFTNDDDTLYEINTKLRTALTNYCANSIGTRYIIKSIGGKVDSSFVPVTQETTTVVTEGSTEATTEKPTEATTESKPDDTDEDITVNYNNGYAFTGSGTLTNNSSYGGGYYTVTGSSAGGKNSVAVSNGSAQLIDTDAGATTNLVLPLPSMTSGKMTISGKMKPSVASSNWTLLQVHGNDGELVGIRTNSQSKYGIRVDGNTDNSKIVAVDVKSAANTEMSYSLAIDLDAKTVVLTVDGKSTSAVSFTRSSINKLQFVTATAARNLTVGNITVETAGSTVTVIKGDINNDGKVNSTDVLLALQYLSGSITLESDRIARGDMDNDGVLTIVDAFEIRKAAN